jgi:hypothetical protein
MKLEQGKFCPLIQKDCIGLQCSWFTQVRGMNPNTGKEVDEWGCAVTWLPMLQIETSQQSRQAGAAVESFRNEVVKANQENQQLYIQSLQYKNQIGPLNQPIHILTPEGENDT